jgi:GxxExxY protein
MPNVSSLLHSTITDSIASCFFKVFNYFGPGLDESIYMNALEIELVARGHTVGREVSVTIYYEDRRVGYRRLDMVVDDKVLVEGKAGEKSPPIAEPKTKSYLKITKFEVGILLHFGLKPTFTRLYLENKFKPALRSVRSA